MDADATQQGRGVAAQAQHEFIGREIAGVGLHGGDPPAIGAQPLDGDAEAEGDALGRRHRRKTLGEEMRVARLVARQQQAADEFLAHQSQRRLMRHAPGLVEDGVGHAKPVEYRRIVADVIRLSLVAEQLQQAALPIVVADAGDGAQVAQPVAAVFSQAHHAVLVARVGLGVALAQETGHPRDERRVGDRPEHQRPVVASSSR